MLWRYIKSRSSCSSVAASSGPIFLAIYFASGRAAMMKWMFWVGLLITAADVLIALALTNFGAKSAAKTQALEQSGVLALAQVTGIHETGTRINEQPLVKIDLQISGPGITPFATPGPGDRVAHPAADDHQPQAGRARRPGHEPVPNRLGAKRFGQWRDAGDTSPSPRTTGPTT